MSSQAEITEGAIKALRELEASDFPLITYEDINTDTDCDFVRIHVIPVEPISGTLGCGTWQGIIQISIFIKSGKGAVYSDRIADKIISAFYRGREITEGATTFRINKTPWAGGAFSSGKEIKDGKTHTPVTIQYRAMI